MQQITERMKNSPHKFRNAGISTILPKQTSLYSQLIPQLEPWERREKTFLNSSVNYPKTNLQLKYQESMEDFQQQSKLTERTGFRKQEWKNPLTISLRFQHTQIEGEYILFH